MQGDMKLMDVLTSRPSINLSVTHAGDILIEGSIVRAYYLSKYPSYRVVGAETVDDFLTIFGCYNELWSDNLSRVLEALATEYDPLFNVDISEKETIVYGELFSTKNYGQQGSRKNEGERTNRREEGAHTDTMSDGAHTDTMTDGTHTDTETNAEIHDFAKEGSRLDELGSVENKLNAGGVENVSLSRTNVYPNTDVSAMPPKETISQTLGEVINQQGAQLNKLGSQDSEYISGEREKTNVYGEKVSTNVIGAKESAVSYSAKTIEENIGEFATTTETDAYTDTETQDEHTDTRTREKKGNEGVSITSQSLLEQEYELRKKNAKIEYLDRFILQFCYLYERGCGL